MGPVETTWEHRLRTAGLRVTRPRLSVLGVLSEHSHVDADTIVAAARTEHPTISPQAVTWHVEDRVIVEGHRTIVFA